ncbi:hypothetical protein KLP40_00965 [Hymenobacter sp. NST-14]|uniref:hypothetical protein n=1 Tax=Hymenobacter piscis TaxID=2839984 RepID=UPI001C015EB5|nr:hypothetical protein [Hymenobacter piscis]MBT9391717.1 hypothetical protein [Hymenobacter piscis]
MSWLNLIFLEELWPHHPLAESWFAGLLLACGFGLPWLGAHTAQRVRPHLRQRCWRALWQLAACGAYAVAAMSTGLLALGLLLGLLN